MTGVTRIDSTQNANNFSTIRKHFTHRRNAHCCYTSRTNMSAYFSISLPFSSIFHPSLHTTPHNFRSCPHNTSHIYHLHVQFYHHFTRTSCLSSQQTPREREWLRNYPATRKWMTKARKNYPVIHSKLQIKP